MLKVAVGVIRNEAGEILISKRAEGVHQGGLWEFPGGKVEQGESTFQALQRELDEELGLSIISAKPLINVNYEYSDLNVSLDVLTVTIYEGDAVGLEGQAIKWLPVSDLNSYSFPAANQGIIHAIQLPECYPIVDSCLGDTADMLIHLQYLIDGGYKMIQLRAKDFAKDAFLNLAQQAIELCKTSNVELFVNTSLKTAVNLGAAGVHLNSKLLEKRNEVFERYPVSVAVSCHCEFSLHKAVQLGAKFAVLSAINRTDSHPLTEPLGWQQFAELVKGAQLPVYALGGVCVQDIATVRKCGGQGVAGIRGFLP